MQTRAEYDIESATRNGQEALANARDTLERALREIDSYASRYAECEALRDKADVLNWTTNYLVSSILPNLRIDLLANAQAELMQTQAMHQ